MRRGRYRTLLRRIRITLLLLVFFLVATGGYLNQVGLPGFLKRRLLSDLQARGIKEAASWDARRSTARGPTCTPQYGQTRSETVMKALQFGHIRLFSTVFIVAAKAR